MSLNETLSSILERPETASLKRLAWAYGCAKKGSTEEAQLEKLLIDRVLKSKPSSA